MNCPVYILRPLPFFPQVDKVDLDALVGTSLRSEEEDYVAYYQDGNHGNRRRAQKEKKENLYAKLTDPHLYVNLLKRDSTLGARQRHC